MNESNRQFSEWFHREHGPIDPKDSMARSMHRHARSWASLAWTHSRSVALYGEAKANECPNFAGASCSGHIHCAEFGCVRIHASSVDCAKCGAHGNCGFDCWSCGADYNTYRGINEK